MAATHHEEPEDLARVRWPAVIAAGLVVGAAAGAATATLTTSGTTSLWGATLAVVAMAWIMRMMRAPEGKVIVVGAALAAVAAVTVSSLVFVPAHDTRVGNAHVIKDAKGDCKDCADITAMSVRVADDQYALSIALESEAHEIEIESPTALLTLEVAQGTWQFIRSAEDKFHVAVTESDTTLVVTVSNAAQLGNIAIATEGDRVPDKGFVTPNGKITTAQSSRAPTPTKSVTEPAASAEAVLGNQSDDTADNDTTPVLISLSVLLLGAILGALATRFLRRWLIVSEQA